jgi:hypothetical protein
MDATEHLDNLGTELIRRGWKAEVGHHARPMLHVRNPDAARLNEIILYEDEDATFRWGWDAVIGPAADVSGVADRIQHVLRAISQ